MGVPRFHVESLAGPMSHLSEQEAVHAARARRLTVGEAVILFDGAGREATGHITSATRSSVDVAFQAIVQRPRPTPRLTLAVALPKGPRQDTLVEKCTELGMASLVPLLTRRSVSSASEHKLDRWRRTAIEAAKQSGQVWLPEFHSPEGLAEALARTSAHDLALVAAPGSPEAAANPLPFFETGPQPVSILAFVGPEGGWTQEEMELLTAGGCRPVCLGPNILRVETAAIALAAIVHLAQGRAARIEYQTTQAERES